MATRPDNRSTGYDDHLSRKMSKVQIQLKWMYYIFYFAANAQFGTNNLFKLLNNHLKTYHCFGIGDDFAHLRDVFLRSSRLFWRKTNKFNEHWTLLVHIEKNDR